MRLEGRVSFGPGGDGGRDAWPHPGSLVHPDRKLSRAGAVVGSLHACHRVFLLGTLLGAGWQEQLSPLSSLHRPFLDQLTPLKKMTAKSTFVVLLSNVPCLFQMCCSLCPAKCGRFLYIWNLLLLKRRLT